MKINLLIIISLLFSLNKAYAEKMHSFYLHELETSEHPTVKIKGAVYLLDDLVKIEKKFLELYENGLLIKNYTLEIIDLRSNIKIIEIKYESQRNKISPRNLCIKYIDDYGGLHNRIGEYNNSSDYLGYVDEDGSIFENYNFKKETLDHLNNIECWNLAIINYLAKITNKYYHENQTEKKYVIANRGLNIRKEPTKDSDIIGILKNGEQCTVSLKSYGEILKIKESFDFIIEGRYRKIEHNNTEGYVFDGYLSDFYIFDKEKQTVEEYISAIIKDAQPNSCYNYYKNEIKKIDNKLTYDEFTNTYNLKIERYTDQKVYLIIQSLFGDLQKYSLKIEKNESYLKIYSFINSLGKTHFKIKDSHNEGIHLIWKRN